MVTSKLGRKDIDFMILLSTYLLNEDYSTIQEKMIKLAELGQINAIQYFYLKKTEFEINKKIDKNLKSVLNEDSFEIDLAIRNYLQARNATTLRFGKKFEQLLELENVNLIELEKKCFKKLKNQLEKEESLILFLKYIELKILFGKKLTQTDKQNLKKVQSKLLKQYKENNKNIVIAFTLGKSLLLFGEDDAHKNFGKQILNAVSKRKLSKQLEEAPFPQTKFLKANKTKIKQQTKQDKEKSLQKDSQIVH